MHEDLNHDHEVINRRTGAFSSSEAVEQSISPDEEEKHTLNIKYQPGMRLDVDSVPYYLKEQFIKHGYRYQLTILQCLKSMFIMHNETVNIWTALIPCATLIGLWIYTAFFWNDLSTGSRFVFLVFLSGAIHSFLASTLFHLFGSATSSQWHTVLIRFDFSGIASLIATSFFPPIYYIFYCNPKFRTFYLSTISVLAMIGGGLIMTPGNHKKLKKTRVSVLVATAMFGIIPAVHFLYSCGMPSPILHQTLYIVGMYLMYGMGLVFYITKFPERWKPGKFDYWGHSHQIWHVFVTAATFIHFFGCLFTRNLHRQYGCLQSISNNK